MYGRGPSIWDSFTHTPGKIRNDDNGDITDDHYHRYRDDVQSMKALAVTAYRFSISWPRIFPQGTGAPNPKGLDFYDQLLDNLVANGIAPFPTRPPTPGSFGGSGRWLLICRWCRPKRKAPACSTGLCRWIPMRHLKSPASPTINQLGFRDVGKSRRRLQPPSVGVLKSCGLP
jgi:hypothetical protein